MTNHAAIAREKATFKGGYSSGGNHHHMALLEAQVHATLALVEQQRIANLITLWMNDSAIITDEVFDSVSDQIKAGLGL